MQGEHILIQFIINNFDGQILHTFLHSVGFFGKLLLESGELSWSGDFLGKLVQNLGGTLFESEIHIQMRVNLFIHRVFALFGTELHHLQNHKVAVFGLDRLVKSRVCQ